MPEISSTPKLGWTISRTWLGDPPRGCGGWRRESLKDAAPVPRALAIVQITPRQGIQGRTGLPQAGRQLVHDDLSHYFLTSLPKWQHTASARTWRVTWWA